MSPGRRWDVAIDESALQGRAHTFLVACSMESNAGSLVGSTLDAVVDILAEAGRREDQLRALVIAANAYIDVAVEQPGLARRLPPREFVFDRLQEELRAQGCDRLGDEDWDNLLLLVEAKLFHANVPVCPSLQRHSNLELMQVDPLMFELENLF